MPKFTSVLFVLVSYLGFSQDEKLLHGQIVSEQKPLSGVDIVNINSKKSTTTDSQGNFSILGKIGDELYIITQEYTDRKIVLTQAVFNQSLFIIYLEKKPIELDDVNIIKVQGMKIKLTQGDLDEIKLAKQSQALKVTNVYTGVIENGVDFVRMYKGLVNLFKDKDKEKAEKSAPPIPFRDYLASNFDTAFYTQKLKLKPDEIALFLSFCEADPKSKTILRTNDYLAVLEFLIAKKEEFKKL